MAAMPSVTQTQSQSPRLRHDRTMTAVCFVCNLPILSRQSWLVWQGGNGWDDLMRGQEEESTLRQRLGGRRDSATQISQISPPTETRETSPPPTRRRGSLAHITEMFGWRTQSDNNKGKLTRRLTLEDLAKSMPWGNPGKRRESSAENSFARGFGRGSVKVRQNSQTSGFSDIRSDLARFWGNRRDSIINGTPRHINAPLKKQQEEKKRKEKERRRRESVAVESHEISTQDDGMGPWGISQDDQPSTSGAPTNARRGSSGSTRSREREVINRRDSIEPSRRRRESIHGKNKHHARRRDSTDRQPPPVPPRESIPHSQPQQDNQQATHQPPSAVDSSTKPLSTPSATESRTDGSGQQVLPPPTIITSSVTPPQAASPASTSPAPTSGSVAFSLPGVSSGGETIQASPAPGPTSPSPLPVSSPATTPTAPHPPLSTTRRDSTTQVYSNKSRRDSRTFANQERRQSRDLHSPVRTPRLPRQSTAIDESYMPTGGLTSESGHQARRDSLSPDSASYQRGRRDSRSRLSPERGGSRETSPGRRARRDSLSPDSASFQRSGSRRDSRRDSRSSRLSPDRGGGGGAGPPGSRDVSPKRRDRLRRQSTSLAGGGAGGGGRAPRSPDSSSTCSSRDPSPSGNRSKVGRRSSTQITGPSHPPAIRRQSTTEEILMARGFRRMSTTEEMIRCRNFRRQSSQSDDTGRYRGRRDSSAQITDGTLATMVVETGSTFFDCSTQTEPSPQYDNNHYHEECLRCNSCGLNLAGPNQKRARRFKNHILCDLHFADVALMESSDFMQQLRSFKPQSLGSAVARRKSSTTLIFPLPPQACSVIGPWQSQHRPASASSSAEEICDKYPHNLLPSPGYWIECSRQMINSNIIRDESDSEKEDRDDNDRGPSADDDGEEEDGRRSSCLVEEEDEDDDSYTERTPPPPPRQKTTIEEQWEKNQCFELRSVEQETYEKYFYGTEHWNYFTNDEDLGPIVLSMRQELINTREQFRILVRAVSYTVHGLIPASCVFADRYDREAVVRSLGKEINLNPPLTLGQLPDTPEELLKLDQVFIKSELKVGVLFVKESQQTEEEILDNNVESPLFSEFLEVLGERVRLKGFDKYKGGLDTVHDLTGKISVYTKWRNIEIMFHVSTALPNERNDPQKLQRKRHIGNDIVCVVFLEADNTPFSPMCIKSHFLHTFILVRTSPNIRRDPTRYEVSVVTRDEVSAYKPYLWEQSVFDKGPMFREWLLTKIVNGERASYSAPKFAHMQERTRSQMLEDLVANLANHAVTGQIPKPYRRGSWRPIGHMRPSSPLLDSVRDRFEDYDQLAKDFTKCFLNNEENTSINAGLFDVTFLVGQSKPKTKFVGVRAILAVRSRVFQELLYGIQTGFGSPQVPVAEILARAVPPLHSPQKKSSNFLQVPDIEAPRPKSVPSSPMVKRAITRLGNLTSNWGRSIRKQHSQLNAEDRKKWSSSQDCSNKEKQQQQQQQQQMQLAVPRLSVCADEKIDRAKLAQTEFNIIEFDPDTFRLLLDYLHTSVCPLTCANIPGLICAAEHYDLPELLQACFHHAKQFLRIEVVCIMLNSLENYYWRYTSASELVNMILAFVDTRAHQLFQTPDFLTLSESMVQMIMCRTLDIPEIRKFEAMLGWARHTIRNIASAQIEPKQEFKRIMERLTRDLKLYRIAPEDLIKIVLPTKSIKNERILETLMYQANQGMYRIQDSYFEVCRKRLQKQDSRFSEWESFDYGL